MYIRDDPDLSTLPIVILTSDRSKSTVIEAMKYDIANYLIKPCKEDDLISAVLLNAEDQTIFDASHNSLA